jgi:hypothetical protein
MKPTFIIALASLALLPGLTLAHDKPEPESATKKTEQANPARPAPTAEELESKFRTTLTQATMSGRWCSIDNATLGPEKEDKYTILGVSKLGGDAWLIKARVQYGSKDLVVPVPVQVKWAGDTPVIVVDKFPMPSGGVFSARVLIYAHTYAGTWSGGDHSGLLKGVITNEPEDKSSPK